MKFYICPICGNIVRKVVDQAGTLVCCNQPMKELEAGKTEGALEKHIPVYEVKENEIHVQVGEVLHPMEEKHWITDLFFVTETMEYHKVFKKDEKPVATFPYEEGTLYALCNLHGLWEKEVKK